MFDRNRPKIEIMLKNIFCHKRSCLLEFVRENATSFYYIKRTLSISIQKLAVEVSGSPYCISQLYVNCEV